MLRKKVDPLALMTTETTVQAHSVKSGQRAV